ncbi:heat shock cognate 70 kda protein 1 [Hordeum vulgare]|nr:heat shock cognate 70 kda protein 1 [Hordeum vulgare]
MEDITPLGLWLQPDGCCNRPSWVEMEFNSLGFLFLGCGWKSFSLAQGLWDGHVLHFKFYGVVTLFMKVFRSAGGRLDCCMEDKIGPPAPETEGSPPPPAAAAVTSAPMALGEPA